jgi:hypothetical protein
MAAPRGVWWWREIGSPPSEIHQIEPSHAPKRFQPGHPLDTFSRKNRFSARVFLRAGDFDTFSRKNQFQVQFNRA